MTIKSNKPRLRFRDELGQEYPKWNNEQLGAIFEIRAGGDIAKEHFRKHRDHVYRFPVFANTEKLKGLQGYSDLYRVSTNCITVSGRGSLGIAHARFEKFYPIVRLLVLNPSRESCLAFFAYAINNLRIFNESTGVPQLTAPQLRTYRINFPHFTEQQKIADFLSAVDEKIEQLEKKRSLLEKYKQALMHRLFRQELRFKDEIGQEYPEWSTKRLQDIVDYSQPSKYLVANSEYDDTYSTPVLTAGKSFILGYTNESQGVYAEPLPVIIFDDFTTAFKFVNFPFKAKSSAMKILIARQGENIRFIFEAMKRIKFPLSEHKRYWISEFQRENISYPSSIEQQKIADFLSTIDGKIEIVSHQIEKTRKFKQGLLQQLFV